MTIYVQPRTLHQLPQTFFLRGRGDCQPHHVGLEHDVRGGQSEQRLAQDNLHQDGRYHSSSLGSKVRDEREFHITQQPAASIEH